MNIGGVSSSMGGARMDIGGVSSKMGGGSTPSVSAHSWMKS